MNIVTAAIIKKNDKFLIARRRTQDKLNGKWEFPGGKLEQNETLHKCLEREIFEEFNVIVRCKEILCESIYQYEHGVFKIIAINTEYLKGEFILRVHDKIAWVDPKNLLNYNLLPADVPIAKFLMKEC